MRPLLVVRVAKHIELALLAVAIDGRWPSGLGLQGAMHSFVGAVLFRVARLTTHVPNPEPNPPDVQRAEAMQPDRAERGAIVALDRGRHPDVTKESLEHRLRLGRADRGQ